MDRKSQVDFKVSARCSLVPTMKTVEENNVLFSARKSFVEKEMLFLSRDMKCRPLLITLVDVVVVVVDNISMKENETDTGVCDT